jgi:tetratricopeptide (TPR) repeat protein
MRMFGSPGGFSHRFAGSVLAGLFLWTAGQLMAADTATPLAYLENNYQEAQKHFQSDTNDAAAAWQLGRACFDMSTVQKGSVAEAKFAEEGIAACERARALDPGSAAAHYYLGMDMGQLADTKHNLSAFRMIKDIEREFLAARVLDNKFDYAGPDRNLGLLYRDAPVFASIGSRSKARHHLEDAVQIAPEFPENQLNLIEVYLRWDYQTEAQRQFGELEKMWPEAQKEFTGVPWEMSWTDWNKRLDVIRKKLDKNPKNESPHSTP